MESGRLIQQEPEKDIAGSADRMPKMLPMREHFQHSQSLKCPYFQTPLCKQIVAQGSLPAWYQVGLASTLKDEKLYFGN